MLLSSGRELELLGVIKSAGMRRGEPSGGKEGKGGEGQEWS